MKPGETFHPAGAIEVNGNRSRSLVRVVSKSRWPVQVSSHFHFFEVNPRLEFDRSLAFGMRLDIPAGRSVRWLPGEAKVVQLVSFVGDRYCWGFNGLCDGAASEDRRADALVFAQRRGFAHALEPIASSKPR
jgi:urease beta subunit